MSSLWHEKASAESAQPGRLPATFQVQVNGNPVTVPIGATASVAMLLAGAPCRVSLSGELRTALCGMGICFECRATVNGVAHQRTCQLLCREGMRLDTQPSEPER